MSKTRDGQCIFALSNTWRFCRFIKQCWLINTVFGFLTGITVCVEREAKCLFQGVIVRDTISDDCGKSASRTNTGHTDDKILCSYLWKKKRHTIERVVQALAEVEPSFCERPVQALRDCMRGKLNRLELCQALLEVHTPANFCGIEVNEATDFRILIG